MDAADVEPSLVSWPVFRSKLNVFKSHPLSHPQNIGLALEAVGKRISKTTIRDSNFVLIVKSHGSRKFAIAQGYAPLHDANSPEQLFLALADMEVAAEAVDKAKHINLSPQQIAFDKTLRQESTALKVGGRGSLTSKNEDSSQASAIQMLGKMDEIQESTLEPPGGA